MDETKNLKEMARIAKNSSSRAYAGHMHPLKRVLALQSLNLTEYARSFGIYKAVHLSMPKKAPGSGKDVDMRLGSKRSKKEHEKHDGHG